MASTRTARSNSACMRSSSSCASAPRAMSGWLVTTMASKPACCSAATAGRTPGSSANSASPRGDMPWPLRATSWFSTPSLSRNTARRMRSFLFHRGADSFHQAKGHQVVQHDVERFDVRRRVVRNDHAHVGQFLHRSAIEPAEAQRMAAVFPRVAECAKQVLRPQPGFVAPAAAMHADAHDDVAGAEQRFELFGVHILPTVIVHQRAYQRDVVHQADYAQAWLVGNNRALEQVRGEVCGRAGRASVAARKHGVATLPGLEKHLDGAVDCALVKSLRHLLDALEKAADVSLVAHKRLLHRS